MTCGEKLSTERLGLLQELAPLDEPIADDAGVRRTAPEILVNEIPDDLPAKCFPEIDDIMRDANLGCDGASVVHGTKAAATGLVGHIATHLVEVIGLHRDPDDLVSLLLQKSSGHGRVNPTAHCHDNRYVLRLNHTIEKYQKKSAEETPFFGALK